MKNLVHFSLKQRVFLNLIFVLLMVMGAYAIFDIPVERYPNIHFGKVVIDTFFPGASPDDVEALVTREIEDALEDLENVDYITSNSYRERSSILVKFVDDTDYEQGYAELRLKVLGILDELPETVDPPQFNYLDVNDWLPAISINIYGNRTNRALVLMAEELKNKILQVDDVNEINITGEYVREFHVLADPGKMSRFGITFDQMAAALEGGNITIPAGDYTIDGNEFVIKVDEQFHERDQILQTVVRRDSDGSLVRVADLISGASLSYRDPMVITSVNGKDCVTLQVIKTWDGNALKIVAAVKDIIGEAQDSFHKEGVKIVLTQDSTVKIRDSMRVLGTNLFLGIILVCLLIWSFMGFRNACLTTIGIPFSFLFTIVVMYFSGNSVNELSLFSFVLVSGIIVDDAIVVVENIYRHNQMGKKNLQAVVDGTSEVFMPVVAATLTTVAAFLPMLIMSGYVGEFFALIPKTISFALFASVVECLFILPLHYLDFGPKDVHLKNGNNGNADTGTLLPYDDENRFMSLCRGFFDRILRLALQFRFASISFVLLAFVVAMIIAGLSISGKMPLIKVKFFPDDYSLYYVEVSGPVGTPIEKTSDLLKEISKEIAQTAPSMAESAVAFAGFYLNDDYQAIWGNHLGHVAVTLPAKKKRQFADFPENDVVNHLEWVKNKLHEQFSESGFQLRVRAEKDGPPAGKDVNIRVMGADFRAVNSLSVGIMDFMRSDEVLSRELVDLEDNQGQANRIFRFKVHSELAAEYDLNTTKVAFLAASVLNGRDVGTYRLADEDVDLKLKIDPSLVNNLEGVLKLPILEHPAGPVRLSDVCSSEVYMEKGYLNRFNGQRAITLTANIRYGSALSAPAVVEIVKRFYSERAGNYPGAFLNFAGEYENTRKSYTSLAYAFIVAIVLIYLILATQFQSYLQPFAIISAVIFSLIGVVFGTFLSRSVFTVNSFIAVVGVTGVVVNDSLVLIEFINKRYRTGLSRKEAVLEGTHTRMRPILLTTLTTTLGLLPMALGIPEYSLVWGAMARTFVTGLCTATFLTLFIVPVAWDLIEGLKSKSCKNNFIK